LEVVGAQPLHQEVVDLADDLRHGRQRLSRRARGARAQARDVGQYRTQCLTEALHEIEIEALLDKDALHAERRAAQRERILRPGWLLADREDSGESVELVGERE